MGRLQGDRDRGAVIGTTRCFGACQRALKLARDTDFDVITTTAPQFAVKTDERLDSLPARHPVRPRWT